MVWSVVLLLWPLRVASSSQVRPIRLPMVSTLMYVLQKVVIARYSLQQSWQQVPAR
ncbi:hypothetical protein D3C80_2042300 [compost metagenome]